MAQAVPEQTDDLVVHLGFDLPLLVATSVYKRIGTHFNSGWGPSSSSGGGREVVLARSGLR
jgi:hypothetical protein